MDDFAIALAQRLVPLSQEEVFAKLGYEPSTKQWEFHRATEYDVLYGGAAGGGKTKAIVMHALWAAIAYPGIRIAVFRRSYDELAESVLPELSDVAFGEELGFTWNATASELRRGKSLIRLRYLETLVDASRRQGGQYQLLLFEERTLLAPGIAEIVMERVRTKVTSHVPVLGIRCTSNPGGASHSEVKTRYIDSTKQGERVAEYCPECRELRPCQCGSNDQPETVRFIRATVKDNKYVDPGYVARLMAIPDPARRAAMLDGSWESFGGQVFSEWRYDKHVVDPVPLPDGWMRYAAVDYGFSAPWAVCWAAEDEDGRLWVYRELYEKLVGEHEQARKIKRAEETDPTVYRVGDPSMVAKRGDAESIISAYQDEGVHLDPANNDRLAGWARIHSYLADGPACAHHRAQGIEKCPRMHVFKTCTNLIRTLPALPYSNIKVEDADTHAEDHLPDALRYLCMAIGGDATFYIPDDGVVRTTALDGSPLYTPMGPYAMPPREESDPRWFTPT